MTMKPLDAVISQTDVETIMTALQTIRQTLPFLVVLRPIERRRLRKIGLKSKTFVEQTLDVAEQYPEILPVCLDLEAARRNLALFATLNPILQNLSELQESLECTQMLAGSEAFASARLAYRSIQTVGKDVAGLSGVANDLGQQFRSTRRLANPPESSGSPPPDNA
jgi:hypothetical protein